MFDSYYKKKLFIERRYKALAVFLGILVGMAGVSACSYEVGRMIQGSGKISERSSAP